MAKSPKNVNTKKTLRQETVLPQHTYQSKPSSKDLAVDKLTKIGFIVRNENGVLMVYYEPNTDYLELKKRFIEALKIIDYKSSWGIRAATKAEFNYILENN